MRRFLVEIQYNGKNYGGWQRNDNANTVQKVVETALGKLFSSEITAEGCSRTDAGVSAKQYFFHFDADTKLPCDRVCYKLNRFLPSDVVCQSSVEVDKRFHARKNVLSKTYVYRFYCGEHQKPLINRDAFFVKGRFDVSEAAKACALLVGRHDFSAFRTDSSSKASPIKTVLEARIDSLPDYFEFMVVADGFLYNMVRIMAGTVIAVGQGKTTLSDVQAALDGGRRIESALTLPPKGLTLEKVDYGNTGEFIVK